MARTELIRVGDRPGLLARTWQTIRSYRLPLTLKSPEFARYFGGGPVASGVSVSEMSALRSSPVWGAVTMVSDDIASLPLVLYKRVGKGKERYEDHPLHRLLHDEPNPEMGSMVFRRTMHAHLMLWGNAYAEIERDTIGRPIALWPIVPESVQIFRDGSGTKRYRVSNPSGTSVEFYDRDILHLVGFSHDGSEGASMVAHAREAIGLALAAEMFGASFFGNGATFGGIVSFPGPKPSEVVDKATRDVLEARYAGVRQAHKLLALYNGAKYERTGIPPNEAQFLETRVFQIREVARFFKLPPHKLGDLADATFSNVEQQNIDYFGSRLRPDTVLWNQELNRKLVAKSERRIQVIEHVTQGFLQADAQGRAALYQSLFNLGAITPNEIRALENMNPVDGGDTAFIQLNLVPLNKAEAAADAMIDSQKAKAEPPAPPPAPPVEKDETPPPERAERDEARRALELAQRSIAELGDDLTAMAVGKENEREAKDAEIRTRVDAEARLEALTEQLAVNASLLEDAEERLVIATGSMEARAAEAADLERTLSLVRQDNVDYEEDLKLHIVRLDTAVQLRARSEEERDAALAELSHTKELLDGAQTALAAEQAERTREAERAEKAEYSAAVLAGDVKRLAALDAEGRAERDAARAELSHSKELLDGAHAELAAERLEQAREAAEWRQTTEQFNSDNDTWSTNYTVLLSERDAVKLEADGLRAAVAEAITLGTTAEFRATEAEGKAMGAVAAMQTAQAEKVQAEQRAEQAERDKAIAEAAQAVANALLEERKAAEAVRVAAVMTAHRGLVVDAMRRVLAKETDRARRHQATPQKLRAWVETFYADHVESVTEALRPIVAADMAWRQEAGDPADVARKLADSHCDHSQQQLRMVSSVEDFHGVLERLLQRWESTRPEQVADRLMQEGVAHVRNL